MDNKPDTVVYEIKIQMLADGNKQILAADSNGATMNPFDVREGLQWALTTIQDKIQLAFINSALLKARKAEDTGIIKPRAVI